jgi:hypothetical protein
LAFVGSRLAKIDITAITEKNPIMKQPRCTHGFVRVKSSILAIKLTLETVSFSLSKCFPKLSSLWRAL